MLFNFLKGPRCYGVLVNNHFTVVSAMRNRQGDFRYSPHIVNNNSIKCDFILNHQDYDSAVIEAPDMPANELPQAMQWEAVNVFGDDSQRLFDFYPLPSSQHNNKKLINIVSIEKERIKFIQDKARLENIAINKITVPEIIYKNSVLDDRFCVVIANNNMGKVVIIENGQVYFIRKFNLSYDAEVDGFGYESIFLLELQRSLDYCERQYRMVMPLQFYLLGDAVNDRLVEQLKDNVSQNIKTEFSWSKTFDDRAYLSSDHHFLLSVSYLRKSA